MNKKFVWILLIVIGLVDTVLNLWAFSLGGKAMPLLQAAVGTLIVIAAVVRLRRLQREQAGAASNGDQ